jgi:hypothetical protein
VSRYTEYAHCRTFFSAKVESAIPNEGAYMTANFAILLYFTMLVVSNTASADGTMTGER